MRRRFNPYDLAAAVRHADYLAFLAIQEASCPSVGTFAPAGDGYDCASVLLDGVFIGYVWYCEWSRCWGIQRPSDLHPRWVWTVGQIRPDWSADLCPATYMAAELCVAA